MQTRFEIQLSSPRRLALHALDAGAVSLFAEAFGLANECDTVTLTRRNTADGCVLEVIETMNTQGESEHGDGSGDTERKGNDLVGVKKSRAKGVAYSEG